MPWGKAVPNGSLWKGEQCPAEVKGGQRLALLSSPPATSVWPAEFLATAVFTDPPPGTPTWPRTPPDPKMAAGHLLIRHKAAQAYVTIGGKGRARQTKRPLIY